LQTAPAPQPWYIPYRGPTIFDLRAILQKRDNSRATSNEMMYETTVETNKGKKSECVIQIITQ